MIFQAWIQTQYNYGRSTMVISLRLSIILLPLLKQTKGQKIDETTSIARAILSHIDK